MRPGEKLFEQLSTDAEHADKTKHPKIFIGRIAPPVWTTVTRGLEHLLACADGDPAKLRAALRALVPEYTGDTQRPRVAPALTGALAVELEDLADLADAPEPARPRRSEPTGPMPVLAVP